MLVWQKFLLVVPKSLLAPGHKQMSVYLSLMVISLIRIDGFHEKLFFQGNLFYAIIYKIYLLTIKNGWSLIQSNQYYFRAHKK